MAGRIFVLVALALLAHASVAAGQVGAVLSGVVRDRAGQPVSGVVVTVAAPMPSEHAVRVVITDQSGTYFVDRLHYGTEYAVDVRHPRFRTSSVRASASEGESPVHITLRPRRSRLAAIALFPLRMFGLRESEAVLRRQHLEPARSLQSRMQ